MTRTLSLYGGKISYYNITQLQSAGMAVSGNDKCLSLPVTDVYAITNKWSLKQYVVDMHTGLESPSSAKMRLLSSKFLRRSSSYSQVAMPSASDRRHTSRRFSHMIKQSSHVTGNTSHDLNEAKPFVVVSDFCRLQTHSWYFCLSTIIYFLPV